MPARLPTLPLAKPAALTQYRNFSQRLQLGQLGSWASCVPVVVGSRRRSCVSADSCACGSSGFK